MFGHIGQAPESQIQVDLRLKDWPDPVKDMRAQPMHGSTTSPESGLGSAQFPALDKERYSMFGTDTHANSSLRIQILSVIAFNAKLGWNIWFSNCRHNRETTEKWNTK